MEWELTAGSAEIAHLAKTESCQGRPLVAKDNGTQGPHGGIKGETPLFQKPEYQDDRNGEDDSHDAEIEQKEAERDRRFGIELEKPDRAHGIAPVPVQLFLKFCDLLRHPAILPYQWHRNG